MSQKVNSLTVVFEHDLSEEQAELLATSIKLFAGVIEVEQNVTNNMSFVEDVRAKAKYRDLFIEFYNKHLL